MTDQRATDDPLPRTVHALEAREVLGDLPREGRLVPEPERRWFEGVDGTGRPLRVHPALVSPSSRRLQDLFDHLDAAPEELGLPSRRAAPGRACSMGWFDADEVIETKSFSRYVVRGKGALSPPTATKGKSRYGSRLRLQNARARRGDVVERMRQWWDEFGLADAVLANAPVRLWASLFETELPPPFRPRWSSG